MAKELESSFNNINYVTDKDSTRLVDILMSLNDRYAPFLNLSTSKAPEEAHALAQAGLVVDWVKSKRLLVLVRCLRY